ncbi:lysophosphatidylcholine acyltransferase 2 [Pyxicephalus adspersus]|uniref:lysophosphatidylcholine acyltransferase 2 n=1 Tax=Pyxicephalus adspersus TaxID=30357 RepID=UPI003B5A044D
MLLHNRAPLLPRQKSFIPPQIPNPFIHEINLKFTDRIRMLLCGLFILPLRIIVFVTVLIMAWLIAFCTTSCNLNVGMEPLTGWRRNVSKSILSCLGRLLFFSMGFHVRITGKPASFSESPIFVVSPHSSFFDGIAVVASGMPSTVSREENIAVPIFGRILHSLQPILVSRTDPDSRKNTINEIKKRTTSQGQWPQVCNTEKAFDRVDWRFCDPTLSTHGLRPTHDVMDPFSLFLHNSSSAGQWSLDTVTWTWQGYTATKLLLMTACQFCTNVEVEFLPVYNPSEEEKKDFFLYASNVRNVMAKALGLPITDHTYEDCRLMLTARDLTLPMEAGLVEFTKINKKLGTKWHDVNKQLEVFASIADLSKGGRIGLEEFASHLKLPVSDVLKELFALFDRNKDGTIDFREYIIGIAILCNPANSEETIQMAFKLFDADQDGCITEDEFSSLLRCSLGVPDLEVSALFQDMDADKSAKITYEEFKNFFLKHPEYAKLFTTYLEHQKYYMYISQQKEEEESLLKPHISKDHDDTNIKDESLGTTDKKDD